MCTIYYRRPSQIIIAEFLGVDFLVFPRGNGSEEGQKEIKGRGKVEARDPNKSETSPVESTKHTDRERRDRQVTERKKRRRGSNR